MSTTTDIEKALPIVFNGKSHDVGPTESKDSSGRAPTHEEEEAIEQIPTTTSRNSRNNKNLFIGLAKIITARSNASVIDPGPPPDGGARAWSQAFMGHFVIFNTWGMIATFGVFQQYYTSALHLEPSAVSWIGSMQMLGHFGLGMFSGRMFDAGYFYWSIIPGMLLSVLGMFMTSLSTKYWQLFLAQGLMNGIGNGSK